MDKKIVIKNDDGTCSIITPAPEMFTPDSRTRVDLRNNGIDFNSEDEIYDFIIEKNNLKGKEYRFIEEDAIPTSRFFREAWTDDNKTDTIDVDLSKAVEIKKDQFRELRKPLLDALDIEYMKAMETKADTADIVRQKEELRNITAIDMPTSSEELEAFIPDILKENNDV